MIELCIPTFDAPLRTVCQTGAISLSLILAIISKLPMHTNGIHTPTTKEQPTVFTLLGVGWE